MLDPHKETDGSRNVSEKKGGALPTYLMTAWEAHRPYIHSWYLIKKREQPKKNKKKLAATLANEVIFEAERRQQQIGKSKFTRMEPVRKIAHTPRYARFLLISFEHRLSLSPSFSLSILLCYTFPRLRLLPKNIFMFYLEMPTRLKMTSTNLYEK